MGSRPSAFGLFGHATLPEVCEENPSLQLEKTGYFHSFSNNSREPSLKLYQLQSFNNYSCCVKGNYSHHFSFLDTLRFTGLSLFMPPSGLLNNVSLYYIMSQSSIKH